MTAPCFGVEFDIDGTFCRGNLWPVVITEGVQITVEGGGCLGGAISADPKNLKIGAISHQEQGLAHQISIRNWCATGLIQTDKLPQDVLSRFKGEVASIQG